MGTLGNDSTDIIILPPDLYLTDPKSGAVIKCLQRIQVVLARAMDGAEWFRNAMSRSLREWTWVDSNEVEGVVCHRNWSIGVYMLRFLGVNEWHALEVCNADSTSLFRNTPTSARRQIRSTAECAVTGMCPFPS
jgi:hypothetical protein